MSDPGEQHKPLLDQIIEDAAAGNPFVFGTAGQPKVILLSYERYENLLEAEAILTRMDAYVASHRTVPKSEDDDALSG